MFVYAFCAERKNFQHDIFYCPIRQFFLSYMSVFIKSGIFFVTKFVTRITNFVTCVSNFVTSVTNFVINFFCAESKKYLRRERKVSAQKGKIIFMIKNIICREREHCHV